MALSQKVPAINHGQHLLPDVNQHQTATDSMQQLKRQTAQTATQETFDFG